MILNKPEELIGLDQKVSGRFGGIARMSDTGSIPTGRESGPKVLVVEYAERGARCRRPLGRLTVRHAVGGMGRRERKKRMLSCNGVDTG